MVEKPGKERIGREEGKGLLDRVVKLKKGIAELVLLFFLTSPSVSPAHGQEIKKTFEQTVQVERLEGQHLAQVASTQYAKESRQIFETQKSALELTKQFNDLKLIKEFIKPNSPIGMNSFEALTIDVPSRFDFSPLVQSKIRELFVEGASLKWWPEGMETLRRNIKGTRYEIKRAEVEVKVVQETDEIIEFIKSILLEELRKRGKRTDVLESILNRLAFRISALATINIEIIDLETWQYLTLIGFGAPRRVGGISPYDRESAIREAITNAFDNLEIVLKQALGLISYSGKVFIIAS
mgnify:CR=1 FL=1